MIAAARRLANFSGVRSLTKVLVVQGTGFNWPEPDHFRVVFLPRLEDLQQAIGRIEHFLSGYRQ